jgi:hypothetical protein
MPAAEASSSITQHYSSRSPPHLHVERAISVAFGPSIPLAVDATQTQLSADHSVAVGCLAAIGHKLCQLPTEQRA